MLVAIIKNSCSFSTFEKILYYIFGIYIYYNYVIIMHKDQIQTISHKIIILTKLTIMHIQRIYYNEY